MRGDPLIRALRPTDSLAELTTLLHRAYARNAAEGLRFVASHQSEEVTRERAQEGECLVAFVGDRLVGTVTLVPPGRARGAAFYERPDVAKVHQVAVDPELQGRGIARALMDRAEARARELGAAHVALDTAEGAARLIRMYELRGYRFVEHVDWRPRTNYLSVLLALALEGDGVGLAGGVSTTKELLR